MIKFLGDLPKKCTVAFSGGVDSVAVTDFLLNGKREVELAFFHHGTKTSDDAENFVKKFSNERGIKLTIGRIDSSISMKKLSIEEYWRNQRYSFLEKFSQPVITCHHLDDVAETWIFTSIHGNSKLIPYSRKNILRPFLISDKNELIRWAKNRHLEWAEDESNKDLKYARNRIRHAIVPEVLKINPGIKTMLRKKYLHL
jgi:tRNA(Ile)-lysidine synthase